MKKMLGFIALGSLSAMCLAGPTNAVITLAWDYPVEELSTNLTFRIYSSQVNGTPSTNWVVLSSVVGTNLQATVNVGFGHHWFSATASNLYGESDFSNTATTSPLPRTPGNLRIVTP